jgi:DNA-binding CsgD family transcriptional regulator
VALGLVHGFDHSARKSTSDVRGTLPGCSDGEGPSQGTACRAQSLDNRGVSHVSACEDRESRRKALQEAALKSAKRLKGREFLTGREAEAVAYAAAGMTDREIAQRCSLSQETVGTYWRRIHTKLHCATRTEAVAVVLWSELNSTRERLRQARAELKEALENHDEPSEE